MVDKRLAFEKGVQREKVKTSELSCLYARMAAKQLLVSNFIKISRSKDVGDIRQHPVIEKNRSKDRSFNFFVLRRNSALYAACSHISYSLSSSAAVSSTASSSSTTSSAAAAAAASAAAFSAALAASAASLAC